MWKTKKFQRLVLLIREVLTGDGVRLRPLLTGAPCPVCGPNRRRLAFFAPSAAPTGGQEKENVPSSPARGEDEPIEQERQSALLRRAGRDFAQLLCSTPAARADGEQEATEPAGDGNPASPSARGEAEPVEQEHQSANRPPQETPSQGENLSTPSRGEDEPIEQKRQGAPCPQIGRAHA